MNWRIRIVQFLIDINESIFFYPKLRAFYKSALKVKNPTIIDVGSNKGQSIEFFSKIFKNTKLISFEPNQKLYNQLKIKYGSNSRIQLHNLGISNYEGSRTFYENVMHETSTFEKLNFDSGYLKKKANLLGVSPRNLIRNTYEVETTTLGSFLHSENIQKVDILKIDVEGHEYMCLQGLFDKDYKTPQINFIQLEYHTDDMYRESALKEKSIFNILEKHGYTKVKRIKHGFGGIYEMIFQNEFYV